MRVQILCSFLLIGSANILAPSRAQAANEQTGIHCGLTDDYGGDQKQGYWQPTGTEQKLHKLSSNQIAALSPMTKKAIIEGGSRLMRLLYEDEHIFIPISQTPQLDAQSMINFLKSKSESTHVVSQSFVFNKTHLLAIRFWPGGNPFGVILAAPKNKYRPRPIAWILDGSIYCIDPRGP